MSSKLTKSDTSASQKNPKPSQNEEEESKEITQIQKEKPWTFGLWWKKNKQAATGQAKSGVEKAEKLTQGISKGLSKGIGKLGELTKTIINTAAANMQDNPMIADQYWSDIKQPERKKDENEERKSAETDTTASENRDAEEEVDEEGEEEEEYDEEDEEEEEEDEDEDEEESPELNKPQEKQQQSTPGGEEEDKFAIDNDFAIDDEDEEVTVVREKSGGSKDDVSAEAKQEVAEKKKKKGKGKAKKKKTGVKAKKAVVKKAEHQDMVLEEVFVNKKYAFGDPFASYHQFYFRGDFLNWDPEEYFAVSMINEKTGLTDFIFKENHYVTIFDQIFYYTKKEKYEGETLALVLESYPLSRLVRMDKVDRKKRVNISFYIEDTPQNVQREMVLEVKNYAKFIKTINDSVNKITSSYHILRFNIE